jgi:hypothetical protein
MEVHVDCNANRWNGGSVGNMRKIEPCDDFCQPNSMPRNGDTEKDNLKMSLVGGLVLRPLPRISKNPDVKMPATHTHPHQRNQMDE